MNNAKIKKMSKTKYGCFNLRIDLTTNLHKIIISTTDEFSQKDLDELFHHIKKILKSIKKTNQFYFYSWTIIEKNYGSKTGEDHIKKIIKSLKDNNFLSQYKNIYHEIKAGRGETNIYYQILDVTDLTHKSEITFILSNGYYYDGQFSYAKH